MPAGCLAIVTDAMRPTAPGPRRPHGRCVRFSDRATACIDSIEQPNQSGWSADHRVDGRLRAM